MVIIILWVVFPGQQCGECWWHGDGPATRQPRQDVHDHQLRRGRHLGAARHYSSNRGCCLSCQCEELLKWLPLWFAIWTEQTFVFYIYCLLSFSIHVSLNKTLIWKLCSLQYYLANTDTNVTNISWRIPLSNYQ